MYGSNSWNHNQRGQGLMPSLLGTPYNAAMYSNVQYSQPMMSYQQQQRQQQQPPPQNKSRYMGGSNNQHHNRNMNKNNDRKSPDRHKSGSHEIPPQNIPSTQANEATPQASEIVPEIKDTSGKDQEANQDIGGGGGDETAKPQAKSSSESVGAQNVPDCTTPKELQGNKTDANLPSKPPQAATPSASDNKMDIRITESQLDLEETNSQDSKSSFKVSGESAKQFPFYCELCDAKCNSESNYKDHLLGSRHLRNVKLKGSVKSPNTPIESRLGSKLSCISDPLIGLNFLTEFQSPDPQVEDKYFCSLCQVRGNARVTIAHITGIKHRMAVLHECHPEQHERICNQPNRDLMSKTVTRIASDFEKRFGRGIINVITDSHPDLPLKRPANQPEKSQDNKRMRTDKFPNKRDPDFTSDTVDQPYSESRGRIDFEAENKENKSFADEGYMDNQKFSSPNVGGRYQKNEKSYWQDGNDNPVDQPFEMHQYDEADPHAPKDRLPRLQPIDYGHNRPVMDYEGGMQPDDFGGRQEPHLPSDVKPKVQEEDPFEKFLNDDPNNLSLSKGNLGTLLKVLTKCVIKNEEDAEMALQVSNALTKSLLKYRLQNMPPEVLSATLQSSKKMLFGDTLKNAPPVAQIPPHSDTPISGTPRSGATPAPPSLPPPQVSSNSLLPTPSIPPTNPHYRSMSGYGQQHYDRY